MKIQTVCDNRIFQRAYRKGKKYAGRFIVVYVLMRSGKKSQAEQSQPQAEQKQTRDLTRTSPRRDLHANLHANPHANPTRLGLTVTKGRGSAVVRNRIKRIIRAAYSDVASRCDVADGCDVIIVARDASVNASSRDIVPELERALSTLGILIPKTADGPESSGGES